MSKEKINRINELARKKKTSGLSEDEQVEQEELRQAYLANFRKYLATQVESVKIVDQDGNDLTSEKVKQIQKEKGLHQRQTEN
ncbi:DUF896 domain-containing protein [Facklamia sp. DSM 111018]|uniref:UPF0291 protein HZY91_03170 n=1 Tax=Facklamia lactis TaxID=2749967 RepID=A0ABS0LPI7_9LACT|nr:DUF896 domain-containing protein [Facklamia lactis]MBG9985892.1 DUF896 domain-containing protein [Facklamia lactis]